jgi:hypothetical protein
MKAIIYILTFAAVIFTTQNSFSQKKLDVKNDIKYDKTYQVSGKSRTVKMNRGETFHMSLDLKKDKAYYISVSGNKSLSGIQYRLVSTNENPDVLYDNSAYEFSDKTMISVKEDSKVVLEIKTQPASYFSYSSDKKDVKLLIASKKVKSSYLENMPNMIVLASNN